MTVDIAISETEAQLNAEIAKKQTAGQNISMLQNRLEKFRRLKKEMGEDPGFASRITIT